ncbi:MAG: myo-inosose-2 dehydratase [Azospirillaceae bacterium]
MPEIRFGIAPIGWTNSDLPELGGDIPLETCLAESRMAGFTGTESGVKFPMDADALAPILREHGLQLVSGWFSGELLRRSVEEEKERIEEQLATFHTLGAPVLVYAETTGSVQAKQDTPVADRPTMAEADFPAYGAKLTELAEYLADRGVPMTYHHHMGTVVETEAEVDRLMAHTGEAVGLLLDTGHLVFAGGDPIATTKRHGHRINHVHCKDIRRPILDKVRAQRMSFLDGVIEGVFTVPGDGFIDYDAFARTLAEIGYSGWAVVEAEQDPAKAPPLEYARKGYACLERAFTAAGYTIVK